MKKYKVTAGQTVYFTYEIEVIKQKMKSNKKITIKIFRIEI
jgi:endo-1,4-beta-mannosidase